MQLKRFVKVRGVLPNLVARPGAVRTYLGLEPIPVDDLPDGAKRSESFRAVDVVIEKDGAGYLAKACRKGMLLLIDECLAPDHAAATAKFAMKTTARSAPVATAKKDG